ncbi:MAG: rubrerythrin family protein, partial [Clostridia bacterium]
LMADDADEEGFTAIATRMRGVAAIEKTHEERYRNYAKEIADGAIFVNGEIVAWKCRNCGHIHFGKTAPVVCPVCNHPQAYFEIVK